MIGDNITIISVFLLLNSLIIFFHSNLIKLFNIFDVPDQKRKFHKYKTSLFGGTIILINLILYIIFELIINYHRIFDTFFPYFFLGSVLFYVLGLVDDKKDINANLKFIIEVLIIALLVIMDRNLLIEKIYFQSFDFTINLGNYSYIFTVLCITIFINALNMYDGINLQAGSYSLIVILTLLYFSNLSLFLIILIISLVTFLYLNYKSKLFLGDNGTYLLGFIISYLIILTAKYDDYLILSADKIFILMMLPGLDLIRLFIIRLRKKKHPFSSDINHIHHILIKKFGFQKTIFYLIAFSILSNILMILLNNGLILIIIVFSLLYIISATVNEK